MNLSPSHLQKRKQIDSAMSLLIRTVRFFPYLLIATILLTLLNFSIETTLIKNDRILQHLTLFQSLFKFRDIHPETQILFHFGGLNRISLYTEALLNTFRVAASGTLIAFIPALASALWMSRFQSRTVPLPVTARVLRRVVTFLSQVPSLLYGISAVALLSVIRTNSVFLPFNYFQTSALTLAAIMIPELILMMEREFSRVSPELRFASYALGATQNTVIFKQVLPMGCRMILIGTLKAVGRVIGLAAPFIVLSSLNVFEFSTNTLPMSLSEKIFLLSREQNPLSQSSAAAAALILIGLIVIIEIATFAMTKRTLRQREGLR